MTPPLDVDALVLAAGRSTRLSGIFPQRPKPLLEIHGDSVLVRNLRWMAAAGVSQAWINLHHLPEAIQAAVGDGTRLGLRIGYSHEPQLLGTAGAARALAGLWQRPVLIVYGDNLLRFDLRLLWDSYQQSEGAAIAVFNPARHVHTGIASGRMQVDAEERIHAWEERRNGSSQDGGWVNAGAYLIHPAWLAALPAEYPLDFGHDVFPAWLQQGRRLRAHAIHGYCLGLDTPETYREAQQLIEEKHLPLS